MIKLKTPPFFASVFFVVGVVVLLFLSNWQLQKYLQFESIGKPVPKAYIGKLSEPVVPVGTRLHEQKLGFHAYVLFEREKEPNIFVNLGWVGHKDLTLPEEDVELLAYTVPSSGKNMFTPKSDFEKKDFFAFDLKEISQKYELNALDMGNVLYVQELKPQFLDQFVPAKLKQTYLSPVKHLQYASFWTFMAVAMSVIFAIRFVIEKR